MADIPPHEVLVDHIRNVAFGLFEGYFDPGDLEGCVEERDGHARGFIGGEPARGDVYHVHETGQIRREKGGRTPS